MAPARYILTGGYEFHIGDRAQPLFTTMIEGFEHPRLLSCSFAYLPEERAQKFKQHSACFKKYLGEDLAIELARPETFAEQVKRSDIVYLHGGSEPLLAAALQPFDLASLFAGKTVVGSSAGAQVLSTRFFGCTRRYVGTGRGIVPCKVLAHYKSATYNHDPRGPLDWQDAGNQLEAASPILPVLRIPEGDFVILNIDAQRKATLWPNL